MARTIILRSVATLVLALGLLLVPMAAHLRSLSQQQQQDQVQRAVARAQASRAALETWLHSAPMVRGYRWAEGAWCIPTPSAVLQQAEPPRGYLLSLHPDPASTLDIVLEEAAWLSPELLSVGYYALCALGLATALLSIGLPAYVRHACKPLQQALQRNHSDLGSLCSQATNLLNTLAETLDRLPAAVIRLDDKQRVQLCNMQAQHVCNRTLEELQAGPLSEQLPEPILHLLGEAQHGQAGLQGRVQLGRGPEQRTWMLRSVPLGDGGALLVAVDRSEDIKAEDALRQSAHLQAISTLSGGLGNTLNNQLTAIMGAAELLAANHLSPDQRQHYAELLLSSVAQAVEQGHRLRAFAGLPSRHHRPLDLNDCVRQAVGLFHRDSARRTTVITGTCSQALPIVGDHHALVSAILALAQNAREAMPDGGRLRVSTTLVEVEAEHTAGLGAGRWAALTVSDTGQGMDALTQARIFEPCFTTKPEAAGLGLSAVYGTVQSLGGRITVDSQLGQGTTFTLYFPLAPEARHRLQRPWRGSGQVLVVDDDHQVRSIARGLLERAGLTVSEAEHGLQALMMHEPGRFDLILLDLNMPELGGVETLRRLRAREPQVRVIILTGDDDQEQRQALLRLGAGAILAKPFRSSALEQLLRAHLPSNESRRLRAVQGTGAP